MARSVTAVVGALVATLACGHYAQAASLQDRFQEANGHYSKNRFGQAKALYLNLIEDFQLENPVVFYNLANTHFRIGELGYAVVNYKRALNLNPDEDLEAAIRDNLERTTEALVDRHRKRDVVQVFDQTHGVAYSVFHLAPAPVVAIVFLVLWCLFFGGLIWRRMSRGATARRIARITALVVIAPLVLSGILMIGNMVTGDAVERGVVIADNVLLRDGKHRDAAATDIPEGLEIRILDDSDPCIVEIQLSNGKRGWVPSGAIERIIAPEGGSLKVADPNASCASP